MEHNAKLRRDQSGKTLETTPLFPAIQLIHDPQALAEKLFKKLRQPGEKFEVKLLLMNFISRLIGCHKLILLSFYSFLQRYLTSHQKDVTHILAYLIQVRIFFARIFLEFYFITSIHIIFNNIFFHDITITFSYRNIYYMIDIYQLFMTLL